MGEGGGANKEKKEKGEGGKRFVMSERVGQVERRRSKRICNRRDSAQRPLPELLSLLVRIQDPPNRTPRFNGRQFIRIERTCGHDVGKKVIDGVGLRDDQSRRWLRRCEDLEVCGRGGVEAVFVGDGRQRRQLCDREAHSRREKGVGKANWGVR